MKKKKKRMIRGICSNKWPRKERREISYFMQVDDDPSRAKR
jgi:hypothetical protein